MVKTYAWIAATASSNIDNIIDGGRRKIILFNLIFSINSLNNKCPAIILAVSRTERVIGRMMDLINSIIVKIGINTKGLPVGIRCAIVFFVFFIQFFIKMEVQIIIALEKQKAIWAVIVNENEIILL
jgi:hypothetical protein